jgi:hypothetical protein
MRRMAELQARLHRARDRDRYVYGGLAALFALLVFAGFSRTYYLKFLFLTPPLPSLVVHAHGVVMTAWVTLFIVQVFLISNRQVRLHQRLGYAGIGLAALVIIVGTWTALLAARHGSRSTPTEFSSQAFSIVPLGDLLNFALLFGAAVYYRRTASRHKTLMALTAINFLPPAIGRLPIGASPLVFAGATIGLAFVCLGYDTWRRRRVDGVLLAAVLILTASFPIRIYLIGTPGWARIAAWLATLVD